MILGLAYCAIKSSLQKTIGHGRMRMPADRQCFVLLGTGKSPEGCGTKSASSWCG